MPVSLEELKRRTLAEGKNLGKGILNVDSFISHQIDTPLMFRVGWELARHFADAGVTEVLTAEISGIAPALATAHALNVPIVYARKTRPVTMTGPVFVDVAPSHTKGSDVFLMLSTEFVAADDFLASGVNRVVYDITSKPPATIEWEYARYQVLTRKVPVASTWRWQYNIEVVELSTLCGLLFQQAASA